MVGALLIGFVLGLALAAIVAGWVWQSYTPGWDHVPSADDIREIVWRD